MQIETRPTESFYIGVTLILCDTLSLVSHSCQFFPSRKLEEKEGFASTGIRRSGHAHQDIQGASAVSQYAGESAETDTAPDQYQDAPRQGEPPGYSSL